jgi:hypothetical protein
LFAKSRSLSAFRAVAGKFYATLRKNFSDAISIRCFRLSVSDLIRAVDTRAVFAALPRVRARCGALRQAAPHFQKIENLHLRSSGRGRNASLITMRRLRLRELYLKASAMADSEFTNVRGTVKFYNEAKG